MKRVLGLALALTVVAGFAAIESVSSQDNTQELANQKKIIARTRGNQDERANENAHENAGPGGPKRGNGITYHGGP